MYHSVNDTALSATQSPFKAVAFVFSKSLSNTPEAANTLAANVILPIILLVSFGEITNLTAASAPVFLKKTVLPKLPEVIKVIQ